jgi:hypothetical protein
MSHSHRKDEPTFVGLLRFFASIVTTLVVFGAIVGYSVSAQTVMASPVVHAERITTTAHTEIARPPEAAVCRPLVKTINYWLPRVLLASAQPDITLDTRAADAVAAYVTNHGYLPQWEVMLSDGIGHLAYALPGSRTAIAIALHRIQRLCPSPTMMSGMI